MRIFNVNHNNKVYEITTDNDNIINDSDRFFGIIDDDKSIDLSGCYFDFDTNKLMYYKKNIIKIVDEYNNFITNLEEIETQIIDANVITSI